MSSYEQTDTRYRAEMEQSSVTLLNALRHQHPRIIDMLTLRADQRPS